MVREREGGRGEDEGTEKRRREGETETDRDTERQSLIVPPRDNEFLYPANKHIFYCYDTCGIFLI